MKTLSIVALIISVIAIAISLFTIRHQSIGQADYIAIAATLLTGVVALAIGYSIYSNLYLSKKVAEEVSKETAQNMMKTFVEKTGTRLSNAITASGSFSTASTYFELGNIMSESGNNKCLEYYKKAQKLCTAARSLYVVCDHKDMIEKCDDFLAEINRRIQVQRP